MYCISYVIKAGDTLYKISRHFNVSIDEIMNANPLINVYNLIVGETMCIPVSIPGNQYTNYTTYLVTQEDSLGSILHKNNINLADFMMFNGLDDIHPVPGSTLKIPIAPDSENDV
jgi:LysM repeat protein